MAWSSSFLYKIYKLPFPPKISNIGTWHGAPNFFYRIYKLHFPPKNSNIGTGYGALNFLYRIYKLLYLSSTWARLLWYCYIYQIQEPVHNCLLHNLNPPLIYDIPKTNKRCWTIIFINSDMNGSLNMCYRVKKMCS